MDWFRAVFAPTDYPEEPPDLVVSSKKRVAKWDEADATLSEASVIDTPVSFSWENGLGANRICLVQVKADRGSAGTGGQVVKEKWKIAEFEKNKEPELDEM